MRTEREMYDLILGFARKDERIRAVGMEGSRTNVNVAADIFQDYDVSYLVTDMDSFLKDHNWIDIFGERIILQMPEITSLYPPSLGNWFSYLMLFTDGNRIDLKLIPVGESGLYTDSDKLLKILLDKDGIFPQLPAPTDKDYHVKRPTEAYFSDCCNEFWWITTYVAKGLWRKEILYANYHLDSILRPCLLSMMSWDAGIKTNFSLSVGKQYKYLDKYTDQEDWKLLLSTYRNSTYEDCWDSLFATVALFRKVALKVARELSYNYNENDDKRVTQYLEYVHGLAPKKMD